MLDISRTIADLPQTSEIYAVDDGQECKELLAIIKRGYSGVTTVIAHSSGKEFSFTLPEEHSATSNHGTPHAGFFLYEPSPATMKSGCFKLLASRFKPSFKLAQDTHLYCSPTPLNNFPGKEYIIEHIIDFNKTGIKEIQKICPRADIAARNFPMRPDELYKKLKIKQGGNCRIMATTLHDKSRKLIVLRRG